MSTKTLTQGDFKGIVQPKIKIVVIYLLSTQKVMLGSMTASVSIHFHCLEWQYSESKWWLRLSVLTNILCVPREKENHAGFKQHEGE